MADDDDEAANGGMGDFPHCLRPLEKRARGTRSSKAGLISTKYSLHRRRREFPQLGAKIVKYVQLTVTSSIKNDYNLH